MKIIAIVFLLVIPALGQNNGQTIKGHHIGESFMEYMVISKGSRENAADALTKCAKLITDHKNQKQRYSDRDIDESEMNFRGEFDSCVQMGNILEGQTALLQSGLQEFLFVSQKLVMIKLSIVDNFDKVERDLIQKYGPPDSQGQVQYENAFGAIFSHPQASWISRTDVIVRANEEPRSLIDQPDAPKIYPVTVKIMDREWAKSISEKELNRPSSLD